MELSYYLSAAIVTLVLLFLRRVVHRLRKHSIALLPGPLGGSWIVGNLPELLRPDHAGTAEFQWTDKYGSSMRVKGALGLDILLTSDPKALQYILNTSGYNFPKPQQNAATSRLTTGEGIVYARGTQHARHRKIMNPAFSYTALRVFLPLFRHTAQKGVSKWKNIVAQEDNISGVIDIPSWLARMTLDAMGSAAFDYEFGALDEDDNELAKVYRNLLVDAFFKRSNVTLVFEALWGYLPWGIVMIIQMLPTKQLKRLRGYIKAAGRVAKNIVDIQTDRYDAGNEGGKDVMSILIRANLSEDPKTRLGVDELKAQLTTLMLAGHETTASTVTWALYELSTRPMFQDRIREEIKQMRMQAAQRGDGYLSVADLDSMKYLLAVIKETLRYHPIILLLNREAGRDDVIPLSIPQQTRSGEIITSIPVSKGQRIMISVAAYNRLKSVWGEDADKWRPRRFLEGIGTNHKTGLGVIANLATFSSGIRGCIGCVLMIEMQAILIELIENFEFSPAPGNPEIVRSATVVMVPMINGSPGKAQLPLTVTPIG
ncbi:cytochrome P450 [Ramaria rubella]|nr:cytochrome P450 [Ramaria rubella]